MRRREFITLHPCLWRGPFASRQTRRLHATVCILIPMDWLILILGVPAILIPLVLLFGFAGCGRAAGICTDDVDCPLGTQCVDGGCFAVGVDQPNLPPSPPENLHAISLDDQSVSLTWTNNDPAARDFQIKRTPEDGDPVLIPPGFPTGATDRFGSSQEGVTFIYRVQALVEGAPASDFSDTSSATVLPAAPVNFRATAVSFDQIDLSWTNASTITTSSLEERGPGGTFAPIPEYPGTGTTFQHRSLIEGTTHEYQVFAVIHDGVEDDAPQPVLKSAAATASATTLAFTAVFTAPPGTLINEGPDGDFAWSSD